MSTVLNDMWHFAKMTELINLDILSVGVNPDHHYDSCAVEEGMTIRVHTLVQAACRKAQSSFLQFLANLETGFHQVSTRERVSLIHQMIYTRG